MPVRGKPRHLAGGEALSRLIQDQHARAQGEAHTKLQQPLMAIGQRPCDLLCPIRQSHAGQGGHDGGAQFASLRRDGQGHVVVNAQARVDRGDLEGIGDPLAHAGMGVQGGDVLSPQRDAARLHGNAA